MGSSFARIYLLINSQFAYIFLVIASGLYVRANRSCSVSATGVSPRGRVLVDWAMCNHCPVSRRELAFCCNTAWPVYILDSGEKWPISSSLNWFAIMRLELYGQWRSGIRSRMSGHSIHCTIGFLQGLSFKKLQNVFADLRAFSCLIQS